MAWLSPTGFEDPEGVWSSEFNAYDGNLSTYALNDGDDDRDYLVLTINAISCDKVRIYGSILYEGEEIDIEECFIDVYYGGDWHNILDEATITKNTWGEIEISSTQTVTKARIKTSPLSSDMDIRLKEFEFNQVVTVVARPLVGGSLAGGRKGLVS